MSTNSTKAFRDISDKLPEKRKIVFNKLAEKPDSTFYDIAYSLGWNVNVVSNRMNELENAGLIKKTGKEVRGKFSRDLFSVVTDKEEITEAQNRLYVFFTESQSDLEKDYHRCESECGKKLIEKRIRYMKNKISNLKEISIF